MRFQRFLEVLRVVEPKQFSGGRTDGPNVGQIRAVIGTTLGIGGKRHGTERAAMEVISHSEDERFVLGDPLDFISPLAREFDSRLDRLRASVHGKDHFKAEELDRYGSEKRWHRYGRNPKHTSVTNFENTGKTSL